MSKDGERKVLFIGGTAYSGSTLMNLLISNDPNGFSCGEVHALVQPYLPYHVNFRCGCGDRNCQIWRDCSEAKPRSVHLWLLNRFPNLQFLVDSSKGVSWILPSARLVRKEGVEVKHLLIWKSPAEFLASRMKRGETKRWASAWLDYHRFYLSAFPECASVRYQDLVENPETLKSVCKWLDIEYFDSKVQYWEKEQHTLFGNSSAKIHLYSEGSDIYKRLDQELGRLDKKSNAGEISHKSVRYEAVSSAQVANHSTKRQQLLFEEVLGRIVSRDVSRLVMNSSAQDRSRYVWGWTLPRYIYQTAMRNLRTRLFRLTYRQQD